MPPGRSSRGQDGDGRRGSSTCSSTPWHSTRSALPGATTSSRPAASPCTRADAATPASRGPALERGERVGAGVDDGDPVAELGQRHGEAAGAAAGVEDVERRAPAGAGRRDSLAQHVPHHGGAGRAATAVVGHSRTPERVSTRAARAGVPELARRLRAFLAGGRLGVVAGRLEVGVRRLAEPARVHQHPARPAHAPADPALADLARLVDRRRCHRRGRVITGRVERLSAAPATGLLGDRAGSRPSARRPRRDRRAARPSCSTVSSQQPVARIDTPRGPVRRTWPRIDQQPGVEQRRGVGTLGVLEERRVDRAASRRRG